MTDILLRAVNIGERIRAMQELSVMAQAFFAIILIFGIINCILGYRLLRFWMMLSGFGIGAGLGLFAAYQFHVQEKMIYLGAALGVGIALAVVAFLIFKAGIFILGAGLGLTLSLYIIHPTTSFTFFMCLLLGCGLGVAAMRFEREVIVVGTSLVGGVLSGFSLAKLTALSEIPYGILMSIGFALLGMLIQFALNKPKYVEDDYEDYDRDSPHRSKRDSRRDEELTELYLEEDEDEIIEEYLDDYYGIERKPEKKAAPEQRQRRRAERTEQPDSPRRRAERTEQPDSPHRRTERTAQSDSPHRGTERTAQSDSPHRSKKNSRRDEELTELYLEEDEDEIIEEYLDDYYGIERKPEKKAAPEQRPRRRAERIEQSDSVRRGTERTAQSDSPRRGTERTAQSDSPRRGTERTAQSDSPRRRAERTEQPDSPRRRTERTEQSDSPRRRAERTEQPDSSHRRAERTAQPDRAHRARHSAKPHSAPVWVDLDSPEEVTELHRKAWEQKKDGDCKTHKKRDEECKD